MGERLVTDIGGFEAGEVPREEQPPLFWQRQLMAVFNLLWRDCLVGVALPRTPAGG
jgi:hypothetical protein